MHVTKLGVSSGVIIIVISISAWLLHSRTPHTTNPIPASLRSAVSFTLYYPSKLPTNYVYKQNSASMSDSGVVFFRIVNKDGQVVIVSEQPEPSAKLALSSLVGYSPIQNTVGKGVIGTQNSAPSALMETPKTLITISGTQDVPTNVISTIAENLEQVTH